METWNKNILPVPGKPRSKRYAGLMSLCRHTDNRWRPRSRKIPAPKSCC